MAGILTRRFRSFQFYLATRVGRCNKMAFVKIGLLSVLPPGEVMEAQIDGHRYAICHAGGELHCLDGECPCTGGPLSQGAIRHQLLVCPWHGWRFDYKTGICAYDDAVKLAKFPVRVDKDEIWVDVGTPE
jgi:toluene monooxygenase system ferredoxin subunit